MIDLATLGKQVATSKALAQASREALDAAPDALRQEKRWAEVEKELEGLAEVSEKTRNAGKFIIKNEGEIDAIKLGKIAARIKKEYNVIIELIDKNNQNYAELFKRWQKKPIDGMWVEQNLISKNYGVPLEGPGVYLFRGTAYEDDIEQLYEVTSYTVQHELFHLEMWVKIKELYPSNYSKTFHRIPDEIHETFVISQFVKAKKYTQWDELDILADLKAFNFNFKKSMSLADFEKFDLDNYLKNIAK